MSGSTEPPRIEDVLDDITKIVNKYIRKFKIRDNEKAKEAFQQGLVGALEAYEKFDPSKSNAKFTSYANNFILGNVYDYVWKDISHGVWGLPDAEDQETIDVDEMVGNVAKLMVAKTNKTSKKEIDAILRQASTSSEVRDEILRKLEEKKRLLGPIKLKLESQFYSMRSHVNQDVEEEAFKNEKREALAECIKELELIEKDILYYRFWKGLDMGETGDIKQCTRERIRQIEAWAIRKLRRCMREKI